MLRKRTGIFTLLYMSFWAIVCLIPFVMLVSASFSSELTLKVEGYSLFPKKVSFAAYEMVFRQYEMILRAYLTTICTTTLGTIGSLFLQSSLGYALSRKDYKLNYLVSKYLYFTMMFGGGLIPTYMLVANYLHMKDTFWVLVVPILMSGSNVYMLRNFFSQLPYSVIESAKLDGANEITIYFRLALPMTKTGLATVAVFLILSFWNESFQSMLYMSTDKITTLQYLLTRIMQNVSFIQQKGDMSGGMISVADMPAKTLSMAMVVITTGPMLCIFPFLQKYFVRGLTNGAVKG